MYRVGGIDQVGKGECIGPIFITLCYGDFNAKDQHQLVPYVGESKKICDKVLRNMTHVIEQFNLKFLTIKINPSQIDLQNVNDLLTKNQRTLSERSNCDMLYVDSHYQDADKLRKLLSRPFLELVVQNKLDATNPFTGIASIHAAVQRRNWLKQVRQKLKQDVGSGNLTDPRTISYIKNNYPNVPYLRKKWSLKSIGL